MNPYSSKQASSAFGNVDSPYTHRLSEISSLPTTPTVKLFIYLEIIKDIILQQLSVVNRQWGPISPTNALNHKSPFHLGGICGQ